MDEDGRIVLEVDIDNQAGPAHLPKALTGLSTAEIGAWFEKQRAKEREEGEKQRAEKKRAFDVSHERY